MFNVPRLDTTYASVVASGCGLPLMILYMASNATTIASLAAFRVLKISEAYPPLSASHWSFPPVIWPMRCGYSPVRMTLHFPVA